MKPVSFISFDVEALPGRAERDHVDKLIWGKFDGREYGIRRLCGILREYGIKGNFMLDLSSCVLYGDRVVEEIGNYLLEEGHELHVHLHSEWLIRKWGLKGDFSGPAGLNQLDEATNRAFLRFAFFKFRQLFNHDPVVFRGGGYHFNEHTILSAQEAGFRCLSNFNAQRHQAEIAVMGAAAENEPFSWRCGILEIPVDFSPEPLSFDINKYYGWYDRARFRKKENKTFNLTLHSWSLLKKEGELFSSYSPEHEKRFRHICQHMVENTVPLGYSEYLEGRTFPEVAQCSFSTTARNVLNRDCTCSICGACFMRQSTDICPGCGSRARHRQIRDALEKIGNPFDSRRVLANFANRIEREFILHSATEVLNFDIRPVREVDIQMDIQHMTRIEDNSFDGFLAVHVLNHVANDQAALNEIYRVLRPGGVALITIPYRLNERTSIYENITEHYGQEACQKYGVGTYRRYGFDDAVRLFKGLFDVSIVDGFDSVTQQSMAVFFLTKPEKSKANQ